MLGIANPNPNPRNLEDLKKNKFFHARLCSDSFGHFTVQLLRRQIKDIKWKLKIFCSLLEKLKKQKNECEQ